MKVGPLSGAASAGRGPMAAEPPADIPRRSPGRDRPAGMIPGLSVNAETYLAISVVAVISLLVVPLPPFLLDAFLAMSFALSIVVILVVLAAKEPLEFSIFPSLLLLVTLFRLALNVNSTRLILSTGTAGEVISAFGNFVIAGNVVVGLVIFLILVVINFVVITKGAGRIAEVAARFTLDAMPGRQMSIDADLGAGLIDEVEARRRREEISRYADFYGSMDGAGKFVRGDAIAGLVITFINLIGGFVIGLTQRGMTAGQALSTYSSLTVGDGLVTQIPALIVSTAAGILVTYGSSGTAMGPSLGTQLTNSTRVLWTVAGILGVFAALPGLPTIPFLVTAGAVAALALRTGRSRGARPSGTASQGGSARIEAPELPRVSEVLAVEPLEVEIGYSLVPMVNDSGDGDMLQRIGILRKQLALELGIIIPSARIRDNIQRPPTEYAIKLRGVQVASGELLPRHLLALDTEGTAKPMEGERTAEPCFGIPSIWIPRERRGEAEGAGYTVVEPQTALTTHLMETIRRHAADILSRQMTRELLDGLKESHPALVEDVVPSRVPLGTVHRVLQRLLMEEVPIRDLVTILEALSDASELTKDPDQLAEHVRRALSLVIVQKIGGSEGPIRAITVGPHLELSLMRLFHPRKDEERALEPSKLTEILDSLGGILRSAEGERRRPPLITPPALRSGIRRLIEPIHPRLAVVSLAELPPQTPIQSIHQWEVPDAA